MSGPEMEIDRKTFREGDVDWTNEIRNHTGFYNFTDGNLQACLMFEGETRMHIIRNMDPESELTDAINKAVKADPRIRRVIAGCFQDVTGGVNALMGQIVDGPGRPLLGERRPTRAYVGY